jgi:hypothetical protein
MEMFSESKHVLIKIKQASKNYASVIPRKDLDNIGNALRLDWSKIKGPILLHPPVTLILKVLQKVSNQKMC